MWDLSSLIRDQTWVPLRSFNHWTSREVSNTYLDYIQCFTSLGVSMFLEHISLHLCDYLCRAVFCS